jgi:hypothetical protein
VAAEELGVEEWADVIDAQLASTLLQLRQRHLQPVCGVAVLCWV